MWQSTVQDRLDSWRQVRESFNHLNFEQSLLATTKLWSFAPYVNHYLDYHYPDSWPDPWNLLADNYYCDLAKTLGMLYTLYLSNHGTQHEYSIKIMVDPRNNSIYNMLWIDQGKYILNYVFGEVVNTARLHSELVELKHYSDQDLQLDRYT